MKDEAEQAITKENIGRLKLVCISPLLEGELHKELSISGEGKLVEYLLQDQSILQEYLEIKEVMQLFTIEQYLRIQIYIITKQ